MIVFKWYLKISVKVSIIYLQQQDVKKTKFLQKLHKLLHVFSYWLINHQQPVRVGLSTPRLLCKSPLCFSKLSTAIDGPWQSLPSPFLLSPPIQKSRQISAAFTCSNAHSQLGKRGTGASAQKLFPLVGLIRNGKTIWECQQNCPSVHLLAHIMTQDALSVWSSLQVSTDCGSLHNIHASLSSLLVTSVLLRSLLTLATILSLLAPKQILQYCLSLFLFFLTQRATVLLSGPGRCTSQAAIW